MSDSKSAPVSHYWSDLQKHAWDGIWMNEAAVRERINLRVTGDPLVWPIQWLPTVIPGRTPFARALSIGCGVGHLERSLVDHGIVREITGVDVSPEVLAEAARRTAEAGCGDRIAYVAGDAREVLGRTRDLDAVFFHESLHHFDRLSELLGLVRDALAPGGILYLDEYVGPARDEWTWRDLVRWNLVYWSLPRAVRRTRVIRVPVTDDDPTEAVASSGILPAVSEHFRILARRDYGGDLLEPIYPSLLRPDQPNGPSAELFASVITTLLDREERMLARGRARFQTVVVAEAR
ncbi:MAG TPA: class I SAM-dependent methyltransferase [Thermoanaerobaculia bacterium]